eukprot:Mycagemm_TRINITY_DN10360_c1_g3::TRINITY_DN10360_c1_g3_i2::g.1272::m.1272 type:complete len:146 gc:universal TRINITY_DN10360_c1_g3_i2:709-1146(+)
MWQGAARGTVAISPDKAPEKTPLGAVGVVVVAVVVVDAAYVITSLRATDGSLSRRRRLGVLLDGTDFAVSGVGLCSSSMSALLLLVLLLLLLLGTMMPLVLVVMRYHVSSHLGSGINAEYGGVLRNASTRVPLLCFAGELNRTSP